MPMIVYRIAKSLSRAKDLSGFGAYKYGGRLNSKGTGMLYTSMNSSLAYLESLAHFDGQDLPPNLYITSIEIKSGPIPGGLIYELPDAEYPGEWQVHDNLENKMTGDKWMLENKFIGFKVRSAINPSEYNYLLNPLYPGYNNIVTVKSVLLLNIDARLIR